MKLLFTILLTLTSFITFSQCPKATNAEFLKGKWIGRFHQYSCGLNEKYPMTIEVNEVKGNTFKGFFIWRTSDDPFNGKTTLEGKLVGNKIFLYEDNLISGQNIVLHGVYEVNIVDCTTLKGKWRLTKLQRGCDNPKTLEDGGNFTINKLVPHQKVLSKKVEKKQEKAEDEKIKVVEEGRKVVVKDQLEAKSDYITIKLWDNGQEDGDIITLKINDKVVLKKFSVTRKIHELIIPLEEEENILELYAENLGSVPPNTAAIAVLSGKRIIKQLVLKSDMKKSEAIKIIKRTK